MGCVQIITATKNYIQDEKNGVLFKKQTVKSLQEALIRFRKLKFNSKTVVKSAQAFDVAEF